MQASQNHYVKALIGYNLIITKFFYKILVVTSHPLNNVLKV